jgi:hypothetical protein
LFPYLGSYRFPVRVTLASIYFSFLFGKIFAGICSSRGYSLLSLDRSSFFFRFLAQETRICCRVVAACYIPNPRGQGVVQFLISVLQHRYYVSSETLSLFSAYKRLPNALVVRTQSIIFLTPFVLFLLRKLKLPVRNI